MTMTGWLEDRAAGLAALINGEAEQYLSRANRFRPRPAHPDALGDGA